MVTVAHLAHAGGLALLGGVAFALACNPIFGITSASVDPALDQAPVVDGGDAAADECPAYCATIAKNCTGLRLEYNSIATCMAFCGHFDLGKPGDQEGDSRACRIYHASAAAHDPDFHCPHAGPTGGNHCGTVCKAFCSLDFSICRDRFPYASEAQCQQICPTYPYINRSDAGDLTFEDGPSLNCRLWHLESATVDPVTHCPHTSLSNVHCSIPPDAGLEASH